MSGFPRVYDDTKLRELAQQQLEQNRQMADLTKALLEEVGKTTRLTGAIERLNWLIVALTTVLVFLTIVTVVIAVFG